MNTYTEINAIGISQIANFIRENHRNGAAIAADKTCVAAWARDAEFQLGEGNPASIEIRARDSVTGATQEFTVSNVGLDVFGADE